MHLVENSQSNHRCNAQILTNSQLALLDKGLTFTPVPSFDRFLWINDINLFAHTLALYKHFKRGQYLGVQQQLDKNEALQALEDLARENEGEFIDIKPPLSNLKP